MKKIILQIFATNYGTILRFIVALLVGVIVAACSRIGFELSDEQVVKLAGAVTLLVSGAIGEYVLRSQGISIGEMQTSLQKITPAVIVDKWAGPTTIRAVEIASDAVKRNFETMQWKANAAKEADKETVVIPKP